MSERLVQGLIVSAAVLLVTGLVLKSCAKLGASPGAASQSTSAGDPAADARPGRNTRASFSALAEGHPGEPGRGSGKGSPFVARHGARLGTAVGSPDGTPSAASPTTGSGSADVELPVAATAEGLASLLRQLGDKNAPNRMKLLNDLGAVLAGLENGTFTTALETLGKLDNDGERQMLLSSFLFRLAQTNPESALKFAEQLQDRMVMDSTRSDYVRFGKNTAYNSIFRGWATTDPAGAASWAEKLPQDSLRYVAVNAIASTWADQDLTAAMNWAQRLAESGSGTSTLDMLASRWAGKDLQGALAYYQGLPEGAVRDAFLQGVIPRWITADPDAAINALSGISSEAARQSAVYRAVVQWANTDPAAAARWISQDSQRLNQAITAVVRTWIHRDKEAALQFIRQVSDERTRTDILSTAAAELVTTDARTAVSLLHDMPATAARDSATESLVINWARTDPAAAASWAAQFPAGSTRQTAFSNIALQWAKRDAQAAANWVSTLPDDSARYSAVLGLTVSRVSFTDHATLARWRQTMTQPDLSRATVIEWLQRAEVPEDVRQEVSRLL